MKYSAMDLKAKSWVGNICHKFDDFCSDVEEVMSQETVKYVENKVHIVGVRVKKFCSEVMQDIRTESSIRRPEKVCAADFSHEAMEKKLKSRLKEHHRGVDEKFIEDAQVIKSGGKSKHGGVYKRHGVGVTSNSVDIDPPMKIARTSFSPSGMRNRRMFDRISNTNIPTVGTSKDVAASESEKKLSDTEGNIESDKLKKTDGIQQEVETVEQIKGSHLVETCVIVEEGKHHVPKEPVKQKSYKNKIWNAFSSRRRLTVKEYQELAALYADQPLNAEDEEKSNAKLSATEFPDSEWELL